MTRAYLAPDVILKLLLHPDDKDFEMLERFEEGAMEPVISRFALFEAFACIVREDEVDTRFFIRILRMADLFDEGIPERHYVMTPERKAVLRGLANAKV